MDDEEETYRLWKIRKTIMQVNELVYNVMSNLARRFTVLALFLKDLRLDKRILHEMTIF